MALGMRFGGSAAACEQKVDALARKGLLSGIQRFAGRRDGGRLLRACVLTAHASVSMLMPIPARTGMCCSRRAISTLTQRRRLPRPCQSLAIAIINVCHGLVRLVEQDSR
eukprot:125685-Chlamydomonas_euryale.AAC.6